ncbi:uncharacterized protein LOC117320169 [Pecten maximus]|uniref:uncharacterized protein LOC117320169 n=1 Tax=Pecten maximus TaxID=6579 RepID=UPI00145815DF|nr:uncharacterized protein LOC117320169 [Pecten maximus]
MAPKRRVSRRSVPYDVSRPENWLVSKLKEELKKMGVTPPTHYKHTHLVKLFKETQARSYETNVSNSDVISASSTRQGARSQDASVINNNGGLVNIVEALTQTVASLQANVVQLTDKVTALSTTNSSGNETRVGSACHSLINPDVHISRPVSAAAGSEAQAEQQSFTIHTAMTAFSGTSTGQSPSLSSPYVRTAYGYAAESLPLIETISPNIRKQIIDGKDVNLTTLLIPYINGPSPSSSDKPDPRYTRSLNIGEFIQAFGIYKNILCSVHSSRRVEMDLYERDIIDMATRYNGKGFYEYHCQFSKRAAAHLRYQNILVDWSIRNNTLFCNIFANLKPISCQRCNSTAHTTHFCPNILTPAPKIQQNNYKLDSQTDVHGRYRVYYLGKEICNNFNGERGCQNARCQHLHICVTCKKEHAKLQCPMHISKNGHGPRQPQGQEGFETGIKKLPENSIICRNLLSSRTQPEVTSTLVNKELDKGFLLGPFTDIPYQQYRINPIGIAEGKYSKKKRLIVDLSAPHNDDKHPSLNELIDKQEFSLQYVTIDKAIQVIKDSGKGCWMGKTDITDAFKLIPLHPSLWPFHGIKWDNHYYFYTRLVFGSRSSPKIFDHLSRAICWIAENNYNIKNVLHLLDDFLIVTKPEEQADIIMKQFLEIFHTLDIPLAAHKTVGPTTGLEYLGIYLDSDKMEARLPVEKRDRIMDMLKSFQRRKSCTKRELLSLLGHFNFAARIILPGRSFVSYLIALSTTVNELHHHVKISTECRTDLNMWYTFLQGWNCVSFFIDDDIVAAADIQLFTDSTQRSFGGYYNNKWFQGNFPDLGSEEVSMAFYELYPIVMACVLWGHSWSRKRILFNCDNAATVDIIRKGRNKLYSRLFISLADAEISEPSTERRSKSNCMPSHERFDAGLRHEVEVLWEASLNKNTRTAYSSGLRCFLSFATMCGVIFSRGLPSISEEVLVYFVTHCHQMLKLSAATIQVYLAGIKYFYIKAGLGDPIGDSTQLAYIMRGIKKQSKPTAPKRLPITFEILKSICSLLNGDVFSPYMDLQLVCMCQMAFFGFLRCGEITVRNKTNDQGCVYMKDIFIAQDKSFYTFTLRKSKCDVFHQGVVITIHENNAVSPVKTMDRLYSLRLKAGATPDTPLFCDRYRSDALSRDKFLEYLKQILDRLGLGDKPYSGHSFRIGAATTAAAAGVEDHVIQTLGRWSSDCYTRYIRTSQHVLCQAQNSMCNI